MHPSLPRADIANRLQHSSSRSLEPALESSPEPCSRQSWEGAGTLRAPLPEELRIGRALPVTLRLLSPLKAPLAGPHWGLTPPPQGVNPKALCSASSDGERTY